MGDPPFLLSTTILLHYLQNFPYFKGIIAHYGSYCVPVTCAGIPMYRNFIPHGVFLFIACNFKSESYIHRILLYKEEISHITNKSFYTRMLGFHLRRVCTPAPEPYSLRHTMRQLPLYYTMYTHN